MVIIDPITNHLGDTKIISEEEVRPTLMRLRNLAEELCIPFVITGHLNRRDKGTVPLDRMLGARSFSGVPRTIYLTGPDNQSTERHHFILAQERGLGAPGWRYHTELASMIVDEAVVDQIQIKWDSQDGE